MKLRNRNLPLYFSLFSFLFSLFACAVTPQVTAPDDLDMAIRDASDYLNDNIPARFSLENSMYGPDIFEEINLADAEYEP